MLFWILMLFIAGQVFFMIKGIENIPFFLYNMYGQDHPAKDSNVVFLVKTNEGYFNHKNLSNREQELLLNSVSYYVNLKHDGDGITQSIQKRFANKINATGLDNLTNRLSNGSKALTDFPQWWGRYFQSVSKNKYNSVSVIKSYIYADKAHTKSDYDSLIFSIKLR